MKKTCKRLGAIFLAMAMAVSVLCTGAMASDFTINITSKTAGHTYEAYQVFTGTLDSTKEILSDIQWGSAVKGKETDFLNLLKADETLKGDFTENSYTAAEVAGKLAGYTGENDNKAKAFAAVVGTFIDNQSISTTLKSGEPTTNTGDNTNTTYTYKIDTNAAGYYFVRDIAQNVSHTKYILSVVGETKVTSKDGTVPTVEKKVNNKDADTANIGDTVNFTLTGTLPDNYADYTTYKYVFHDTLSKGLTYNGDVKVYVKNGETDTEISNGYTVDPANGTSKTTPTADTTITVTFNDLKKATSTDGAELNITKDSEIIVKYSATLNENAEIGTKGNTNKVKLEYSNDPNKDGTGTTTEKDVTVYTFQLDVSKIAKKTNNDDADKPLAGAVFELYRLNGTTKEYAQVTDGKLTGWTQTESEATKLTTGEDGKISVAGLKEGTYYLKEITAPDGYNLLTADVTVVISNDTVNVGTLTGVTSTSGVKDETATTTGSVVPGTGVATIKVANAAGSQLPSTGGMGTTLFYVIGGALMAGAAIVLVIKKKRSSAE